jgi:chromosomal replication initiator protein
MAVSEAEWDRVKTRLKQEFGETAYKSWVKPIVPVALRDGEVELAVPTRFMRDWITTHYVERIRVLWSAENPSVRRVALKVAGTATSTTTSSAGTAAAQNARPVAASASDRVLSANPADRPPRANDGKALELARSLGKAPFPTTTPLGAEISAPLDSRYTFENFVVGKPNEFAYAAAKRVAESDNVSFNPLFLYGGVGLGKTHLMHAIAWEIRQRSPHRKVVYLSAEKFMYSFVRALRNQDTVSFKEQFRSVDVLMIDDVQFISGKDATQEEFFHTFNALVDQGRQLVLSADKSPSNLEEIGDRLRSRLASGLVADLHPTTFELRLGILDAKAEQLGTQVPQKVKEFLAHKITSNVRELEGALTRLVAHVQLVGGQITLETAQDLLQDLLRAHDRRLSMEEIQKRVAEHFKIRISDMSSARRARAVARPRQVAMYLSKQLTSRSLPEIGRAFGGRDHTTVMHAVRKVEELVKLDSAFAEDVELLTRMLES